MPAVRIMGFILMVSGCCGLGIWYSMQLGRRINHIRQMMGILDILSSEIQYSRSTMPECCEIISKRAGEPYRSIFADICRQNQQDCGTALGDILEQFLQQGLEHTSLKEEKEIFIRCFSEIGYSDSWLQCQSIERGKVRLQYILDTEETELRKRGKLAVSLGTMSGILLVLLLL